MRCKTCNFILFCTLQDRHTKPRSEAIACPTAFDCIALILQGRQHAFVLHHAGHSHRAGSEASARPTSCDCIALTSQGQCSYTSSNRHHSTIGNVPKVLQPISLSAQFNQASRSTADVHESFKDKSAPSLPLASHQQVYLSHLCTTVTLAVSTHC